MKTKGVFVSFTILEGGGVEGFLSRELAPTQEVGRAVMRLMLPSVGSVVFEKNKDGHTFTGKLRSKDLANVLGGAAEPQ